MSYKLMSSERSPFGRICRMLMIHGQIPFDFIVWNFLDDPKAAQALAKESPINKLPILQISETQKLVDSRVIANYLMATHGLRQLSLEEENIASSIYSCMDVSVNLFLMRASGYDLDVDNTFLKRQKERIPSNLKFLEPWAMQLNPEEPGHWNFASISLFSFLYWADRRAQTIDLRELPSMQIFMERFGHSPGVKETSF